MISPVGNEMIYDWPHVEILLFLEHGQGSSHARSLEETLGTSNCKWTRVKEDGDQEQHAFQRVTMEDDFILNISAFCNERWSSDHRQSETEEDKRTFEKRRRLI